MKSRMVLLTALLACASATIVIWRDATSRIDILERELAQAHADNITLSDQAAAAMGKARAIEEESTQLRAARAISGARLEPTAISTPTPTEPDASAEPKQSGGLLAKMFKDPEVRNMLARQQSVALRTMYSDFLKQATLTPEESDRFFQLLEDRQMALMDSSATAMSGGAVDMKSATASINATDDALKALLGPARFSQYQDFERTLGPRVEVQQFSRQLAGSGYPLQDDQVAGLVRIFSEETASAAGFGEGAPSAPGMSADQIDQYSSQVAAANNRVYARAMAILSPRQLSALAAFQKNIADSQLAGLKMAQRMLKDDQ